MDNHLHNYHGPGDKTIGVIIGASFGIYQGVVNMAGLITLTHILETMILAVIGSTVGFITTTLLKKVTKK